MGEKTINTGHYTITEIAHQGDGMAIDAHGNKIFIPYTLVGEEVTACITQKSRGFSYANLQKIITLSTDRITPLCTDFGQCGGCNLQHMAPQTYRQFKEDILSQALLRHQVDLSHATRHPIIELPHASRRRANFCLWHKAKEGWRLGYYRPNSHQPIAITQCHILLPDLESARHHILQTLPHLTADADLSAMRLTVIDKGLELVAEAKTLSPALHQWLNQLRSHMPIRRLALQTQSGLMLLHEAKNPTVTIAGQKLHYPAGAFLQAAPQAAEILANFVLTHIPDFEPVLDLFAGIGAYASACAARSLSHKNDILALEGDATMVQALRQTAGLFPPAKLKAQRRDLFKNPLTSTELEPWRGIILNPPRAGAEAQCRYLANHRKGRYLVMISCHPEHTARDITILQKGGHWRLSHIQALDQFRFSHHLEVMACLTA